MKRTVRVDAEDPKNGMTAKELGAFVQHVIRDDPNGTAVISAGVTATKGRVKWLQAEVTTGGPDLAETWNAGFNLGKGLVQDE